MERVTAGAVAHVAEAGRARVSILHTGQSRGKGAALQVGFAAAPRSGRRTGLGGPLHRRTHCSNAISPPHNSMFQ